MSARGSQSTDRVEGRPPPRFRFAPSPAALLGAKPSSGAGVQSRPRCLLSQESRGARDEAKRRGMG